MTNLEITAYHEAGHVIAHFLYEDSVPEGFEYVTIKPDHERGSAGHVRLKPIEGLVSPQEFDFLFDDETNKELAGFTQRDLEARLSILLAGEAATYLKTGVRDDYGTGRDTWTGDFRDCMDFLERMFQVGDDPESPDCKGAYSYLDSLFWRTVVILDWKMRWEKIEAIAEALLRKQTLSFEESREILLAID